MLVQITEFPPKPEIRELMEYAVGFEPELEEQAWKTYGSSRNAELYAYEDEGERIGLIGVEQDNQGQLNILHLAVRPEDRLKGYGRGMILDMLLLKKPQTVTAVTDDEGADFFRNIGFSVSGFIGQAGGAEMFRCFYEAEAEEEN
ncbi:GNAT family N-acetyltransferase [Paenibacillus sp. DYY-L-2]|uniref:GNAT family N-acetyltransferase n=1 Tax=Paenibacillus sp. DYY-L-2 TaxID=3447013 RepID=UPI003F50B8EB